MRLSDLRPGARRRRQRRIIEALWIRRNEFAADLTFTPGQRFWAEQQIENRLMYAWVGKDRYRLKDSWVPTRENVLDGYIDWEALLRAPDVPLVSHEEFWTDYLRRPLPTGPINWAERLGIPESSI